MGRQCSNLTGQKFHRLLACYPVGSIKASMCWACICDCGGRHVASTRALRSGRVKSCGCLNRESRVEHVRLIGIRRFIDLTGKRFGRLKVTEFAFRRKRPSGDGYVPFWRTVCDCGSERIVNAYSLTRGDTRSCGCLRDEVAAVTSKARWVAKREKAA